MNKFKKEHFNKLVALRTRAKEIIHIINLNQILDVLVFPIIFIISICAKPFCKNIWIVAENPNEACDNGYIFFKYIRKKRKDINAYYIINKKSKDYEKVKELGNVIQYRSLKHWIYYLNASKIIVTQKYANPSPAIFYILHTRNILKTPRIYLKHGITKDESPMLYYNRTKFRLFICGAKRELEYIKNNYGYPKKNVVYTGFARFDNLNVYEKNNSNTSRIILITPTWRNWIHKQEEFDKFMQNYYILIQNKALVNGLEKYNIELKLVLHKNMKKFKLNYNVESFSKNITINHNEEVDIQDLLNNTDLLITDYSSIFFDIAYRKRPIIYYQFDTEKYRENQLQKGYFSYEKDGFGDILENPDAIANKVKYYIETNFKIESIYSSRMDNFFERKDKNNCKRILEEIEKI